MHSRQAMLSMWEGVYSLESAVEAGPGAGRFPGPPLCVFSLLLYRLGGAAKMSWAPKHTLC